MDLRQFRYFIQAARRENFRKASDDLRVAQSALTRQIQHLETELGFLLFDRVRRGVRLTAAGQRLLERSQHIVGEVDRLKESLQIEAHVPSGPASLAAPPSIGRLLFNKLALTFLKSYPKVNLSLVEGWTSNVLGQLRRGELSLAIVTDPPPDPLLGYTLLFTESLYLQMTWAYVYALGTPLGRYQKAVKEAIGSVIDAGHKSDGQAQAMAAGKSNLVDVATAVTETEVAIESLVSVRDKVIQAYEEIMRMPI